jgi:hypothetical protein
MRRIVQYPSTVHYSDVSSYISPAWHQWLRHTREAAPTIPEQAADLQRQREIKILAAQADARWNAKASFLDMPKATDGGRLPGSKGDINQNPSDSVPSQTRATGGGNGGQETVRAAVLQTGQEQAGEPIVRTDKPTGGLPHTRKIGPLHRYAEQEKVNDDHVRPSVFTNPALRSQATPMKTEVPAQDPNDPWVKAKEARERNMGKGEWQPEAWSPGNVTPKRRGH